MKKLTIAILMLLTSFSIVSAEIGVRIGGSVEVGEFSTSGFENENGEVSETKTEIGNQHLKLLVPKFELYGFS